MRTPVLIVAVAGFVARGLAQSPPAPQGSPQATPPIMRFQAAARIPGSASPVTPSPGPRGIARTLASEQPALPDHGQTETYSFSRAPEYGDVFVVVPNDGSAPIYVSGNFLSLTANDPNMSAERKLAALRGYPRMVQSQYEMTVAGMYPSTSRTYDSPFADQTLTGEDGSTVVLIQDPLAGPYVRVVATSADGSREEYSLARDRVEGIVDNPALTDAQKINALKTFPFRLPEEVRPNFSTVSEQALGDAVARSPALQNQEFVKMRAVYAQVAQAAPAPSPPPAGRVTPGAGAVAPASRPVPAQASPGSTPAAGPVKSVTRVPQPAPRRPAATPAAGARTESAERAIGRGPALAAIVIVLISLAAFGVYLRRRPGR